MYRISKKFNFEASHQLTGLPEDHPCTRVHGHSYSVEFEFQSTELNETGFVIDYRALDGIKNWIDMQVDHRHINEVFPKMNPTAENLAKLFYEVFYLDFPEKLSSVTVKETEKTSATYEPRRK